MTEQERVVFVGGPRDGQEALVGVGTQMVLVPYPPDMAQVWKQDFSPDLRPDTNIRKGMYTPAPQRWDSWDQGQAALALVGFQYSRRDDGAVVFAWGGWMP